MNTQSNNAARAAVTRALGGRKWKCFAGAGTTLPAAIGFGLLLAALPVSAQNPFLPPPPATVSTVPANGDVNPYGVAFVPARFATGGTIHPGDILVSNFNNNQNLQGKGTTIVAFNAKGQQSLFFQGAAPLGLTAALGVTQAGYVFVGNMPTSDGTSATAQPGSVLVLNNKGQLLGSFAGDMAINGPWGMALYDLGSRAQVFISNVLSGTVIRIDLALGPAGIQVRNSVTVATGLSHRPDPAALELGPSGLAYDPAEDILYVAESADNTIRAISDAGSRSSDAGQGVVIYQDPVHLHGPLDLAIVPSGHLIVANSDGSNADPNQPSEIVEFTVKGQFVTQFSVDPNNGGAFGVAVHNLGGAVRFAAVDDNANALLINAVIPQ